MLENEEFSGAFVKLPIQFLERVAAAAENHHQRLAQWVDLTTYDGVLSAVSTWLDSLEHARTQPTPSAEPGDLLVKLKRGEFWSFTSSGWIELAPVYRMGDERADRDFLVGASEAVRSGWVDRDEPTPAASAPTKAGGFFGRSVIEDELERMRAGVADRIERAEEVQREMAEAAEPFEPLEGADLLRSHAEVLFMAIEVIRDRARRDGGGGDVYSEDPWTIAGLEGLAYGYEHAARIVGS